MKKQGFWKSYLICSALLIVSVSSASSQNVLIDDFETYWDEWEMMDVWTYSRAGGPEAVFLFMAEGRDGGQAMEMLIDMPEKWWYNTHHREIPNGPISISDYEAVTFWIKGDPELQGVSMDAACFLYDSTGRILRYTLPREYLQSDQWRMVTLAMTSFVDEQWDAGYGTPNPDADRNDITRIGFMVVGDQDDIFGVLALDEFRLVSELGTTTVSGRVLFADETPFPVVIMNAIGQDHIEQVLTDENGEFVFENLSQGTQYRFAPFFVTYDFSPGVEALTLLEDAYEIEFIGAPSLHDYLDSAEIADDFGPDGLNPAIAYRGAADWYNPGNERPVIDVRQEIVYQVGFPDAPRVDATLPAIAPNPLDGAANPEFAVKIGNFYSWDALILGQNTSRNYFVEVDLYCDLRPELEGFDRASLGVRLNSFDPAQPVLDAKEDTASYMSTGGYALSFESDAGMISARKYAASNSNTRAKNRLAGFAEEFGAIELTESGWHRLRIECNDSQISFYIDGDLIAQVEDNDYRFGPAALHYRACYTDSPDDLANMRHARFDNLKAGPLGETGLNDWMLR